MSSPRWLLFSAWLVLLLVGAWVLRVTPINHDLTQFMPTGASPEQRLAVSLLREGPASR